MRRIFCAAMALAVCFALTSGPGRASGMAELTIRRSDGSSALFNVELAQDDATREKGLMFRKHLASRDGMIFRYKTPGFRAFWMKNTLIPLDILFAAPDGTITHIHAQAEPHSLAQITSGKSDVCAVLEIAGGQAARQNIRVGDRLFLQGASMCLP